MNNIEIHYRRGTLMLYIKSIDSAWTLLNETFKLMESPLSIHNMWKPLGDFNIRMNIDTNIANDVKKEMKRMWILREDWKHE